jgi:hypothetical protein
MLQQSSLCCTSQVWRVDSCAEGRQYEAFKVLSYVCGRSLFQHRCRLTRWCRPGGQGGLRRVLCLLHIARHAVVSVCCMIAVRRLLCCA